MIELGQKFMVMGDWNISPEPDGKIVIRMPPAPPGTYGCWHDTTRMCIKELERRVVPGKSFLDFGAGSGILSVVAYYLGASPIYATELDPKIAKFAQQVWDLNKVSVDLLEEDIPEVDICVANIGDKIFDLRYQIRAKTLISVSTQGELWVVNA